ncbi:hypothetical protein MBANPS3_007881 [Mucor bainieri]
MSLEELNAYIDSHTSTDSYDHSKQNTRERYGKDYAETKASAIKNLGKLRAQEDAASDLRRLVDHYTTSILILDTELHSLESSLASAREAKKEKDALEQRKRKHCNEMEQRMTKKASHVIKKVQLETQLEPKTEEMLQLRVRKTVLQEKMLSTDPHVVKTFTWIQHNQDLFKGEIYNPALSPMTLKDNRYMDQVEAIIGLSNLTQFICEFEADYKILRTAINTLEYRVRIIWTDFSTEHDYSKASLKSTELESCRNMDFFVSDLINAPPFVINTLCLQSDINNIPITLSSVIDPSQIKLASFAIGNDLYKIYTTRDGQHSGQSKMNILPSVYLQLGVCEGSMASLLREVEDLQAKVMEESQAIFSCRISVQDSDALMHSDVGNSKKRGSDCLNEDTELNIQDIEDGIAAVKRDIEEHQAKLKAAKDDLEKQTKEADDFVLSGEYYNTLRDFMISSEEREPGRRNVDWDQVFPKQK